jgi:hypothetical protein
VPTRSPHSRCARGRASRRSSGVEATHPAFAMADHRPARSRLPKTRSLAGRLHLSFCPGGAQPCSCSSPSCSARGWGDCSPFAPIRWSRPGFRGRRAGALGLGSYGRKLNLLSCPSRSSPDLSKRHGASPRAFQIKSEGEKSRSPSSRYPGVLPSFRDRHDRRWTNGVLHYPPG